MKIRSQKWFAAAVMAAAITGLGLVGIGNSVAAAATKSCEQLNGMVIPAASIGLPTTGS